MKKAFIIFLIPFIGYSQIKWKNVNESDILPTIVKTKGRIIFNNNPLVSPESDLYIDRDNEIIVYYDINNKSIFQIEKTDIKSISVSSFRDGAYLTPNEIFDDLSEEFFSVLRQELYLKNNLNKFKITSTEKSPYFFSDNGKLDVSNKNIVNAKLISINQNSIEYIDSLGNVIVQSQNKKLMIEGGDDRTNRKLNRKKIRILNINFDDNVFIGIYDFYNFIYEEYEKNFFSNLIDFKSSFKEKKFSDILLLWGPFSEKFELNDGNFMYTWTFPKKYRESEVISRSSSSSLSSSSATSETYTTANLQSQYGINTNSQVYVSGYKGVIDSYSSVSGNSFLNYYSSNLENQFTSGTTRYSSRQKGSEVEIDQTKKISLIVDENNIIVDILEKNYFEEPYYGIRIKFYK